MGEQQFCPFTDEKLRLPTKIALNSTLYCLILNVTNIFDLQIKQMNIENTQSQMRKGILEFCILSIIKRGEAYPSDIIEEMKNAEMDILEGTLYPLLTRLKNSGMLTYRWEESSAGPPRKYFSLTKQGELFYKELQQTWEELSNAVNALTQITK